MDSSAPLIELLVGGMISQIGGSCVQEAEGSFPGGTESEFLRYAPDNQEDWMTRLKWVEKQSAILLLNAPVLYGLNWGGKVRVQPGCDGLRLSLGLSLSLGRPCPARYTCVLQRGGKEIRIREGDRLARGKAKESTLFALPEWVGAEIRKLSRGVVSACEQYRARADVRNAIAKLGSQRRSELVDLERLYQTSKGSNARLYGMPAPGTEGSASIEAEVRTLQSVILKRYEVTVRIRLLTVGILEGSVPHTVYRAGD